jgi:hypothetical protein
MHAVATITTSLFTAEAHALMHNFVPLAATIPSSSFDLWIVKSTEMLSHTQTSCP